jgi:hypothetical protein
MHLKSALGADAIHGTRNARGTYPINDRVWRLDQDSKGERRTQPPDGEWIVELFYEDAGPYPATLLIPPHQKVALAMELFDDSLDPISPQQALQALPVTNTMVQLAGVPQGIQVAVKVRV